MSEELKPKAKLAMQLRAPSGYRVDMDCLITSDQWTRIQEIIEEPDHKPEPTK